MKILASHPKLLIRSKLSLGWQEIKFLPEELIGRLSKNFHGVDIGPLSKILAVKYMYRVIGGISEENLVVRLF